MPVLITLSPYISTPRAIILHYYRARARTWLISRWHCTARRLRIRHTCVLYMYPRSKTYSSKMRVYIPADPISNPSRALDGQSDVNGISVARARRLPLQDFAYTHIYIYNTLALLSFFVTAAAAAFLPLSIPRSTRDEHVFSLPPKVCV